MSIKTRAKNYTTDEILLLVDLVFENKAQHFGSFSSSLSYDEKNHVWDNIAKEI